MVDAVLLLSLFCVLIGGEEGELERRMKKRKKRRWIILLFWSFTDVPLPTALCALFFPSPPTLPLPSLKGDGEDGQKRRKRRWEQWEW